MLTFKKKLLSVQSNNEQIYREFLQLFAVIAFGFCGEFN